MGIAFVRNRTIQRCNRYLEEMVGVGPGELVGQLFGAGGPARVVIEAVDMVIDGHLAKAI